LVVVYNDAIAGAEAHHYGPLGYNLDLVTFNDTDFAGVARSVGMEAITVRQAEDLAPVAAWAKNLKGPMLIDAKIDSSVCAAWLEDAFNNADHGISHKDPAPAKVKATALAGAK
jgi:thiamine pyrophosphate-dependent acetolactate synthase large subunit-like protein